MPTRWEPVIGMVHAKDPQQLHDYWQKIAAHWTEVQAAGKIKGFSTPAALALSPANLQTNRQRLQSANLSSRAIRLKPRSLRKASVARLSIPLSSCSNNCRALRLRPGSCRIGARNC